jgi:hypothetical protein
MFVECGRSKNFPKNIEKGIDKPYIKWYNEVAPKIRLLKNYLLKKFEKSVDRAL